MSVSGYGYKRKITIQHSKVSGSANLTNFPVSFVFENDSLKTVAEGGKVVSSSGHDIIFTSDSEGNTQLKHEIQEYDGEAGKYIGHVKIPTLSHNANTEIYMWYGKTGASNTEDVYEVWNDHYTGVWHLHQTGSGAYLKNSAQDDYHMSVSGGSQGDGKLGKCRYWENSGTQSLNISDGGDICPGGEVSWTILFTYFVDWDSDSDWESKATFATRNLSSKTTGRVSRQSWRPANAGFLGHWTQVDGSWSYGRANTADVRQQWKMGTLQYDHSVTKVRIKDDNANWGLDFTRGPLDEESENFRMWDNNWKGYCDEVRYADTALSQDFINTVYENIHDNSNFFSLGSEEAISAGTEAHSERGMWLQGKDTSDSERNLHITGSSTLSTDYFNVEFGVESQEADSERGLWISGKDTGDSERSLYISGIDTGESERSLYIQGKDTDDSERNLWVSGKDVGESERGLWVQGRDSDTSERNIWISGKDSSASERGLYIEGKDSGTSERNLHIAGKNTGTSERGLWISGYLKGESERGLWIEGQAVVDERNLWISGKDTAYSERGLYIEGKESAHSERGLWISGITTGESERNIWISGKDTSYSERGLYIVGSKQGEDERGLWISGIDTAHSERGLWIEGKSASINERSLWIAGKDVGMSERGLWINGKGRGWSERGLYIRGEGEETPTIGVKYPLPAFKRP